MLHLVVWVGSGSPTHQVLGENLRQPGQLDPSKPHTNPRTLRALVRSLPGDRARKAPTKVPTPGTLLGSFSLRLSPNTLELGSTHKPNTGSTHAGARAFEDVAAWVAGTLFAATGTAVSGARLPMGELGLQGGAL